MMLIDLIKINKEKLMLAFALLFPLLMLVGVVRNFSPIPYWDMWNGTLGFYISAVNGDWPIWLSQHNEHRIVFARILFFIDNYLFNGTAKFLIFSNFILLSLICISLVKLQKKLIVNEFDRVVLFCVTIAFIYSWGQHENIVWGFQSQFLAAYLFPLLAFYSLVTYKSCNQNLYYFIALFFGVASVGTMGNGVAVLPILLVLAAVLQLKKNYLFGVFVVAVITLGFHFYFYKTPPFHQSMLAGVVKDPIQSVLFLLTYLGAPFYYIVGSLVVSSVFGLILILGCLFATYTYFVKSSNNKNIYILVLLAILLYIGASAFGITGARSIAGVSAATSSRYLTASLVAWVSLITIYLHYFGGTIFKKYLLVFILVLPVLMMPYQLKSSESHSQELYERYIAILALELEVNDEVYLKKVFPFVTWLIDMSGSIKQHNLSIFHDKKFEGVSERINTKLEYMPDAIARGYLDSKEDILASEEYIRVHGWFLGDSNFDNIERLDVLNEQYEIIGAVLTGSIRHDVKRVHGKESLYSGFTGYLLKKESYNKLYFVDLKNNQTLVINNENI